MMDEFEPDESGALIWYRHSGQNTKDVTDFPALAEYIEIFDVSEITEDIGDHVITHLAVHKDIHELLGNIVGKVTHLWLSEVSVSKSPLTRGAFTSLQVLHVKDCSPVPDLFGAFPTLQELYITDCNLMQKAPGSLSSLCQLKKLMIKGSEFYSDFFRLISQLSSLEILSLQDFPLYDFDVSLSALTKLKVLEFSTNNRSNPSRRPKFEALAQLASLEELRVNNCYYLALPMRLTTLKNLKKLELSSFRFHESSNAQLLGRLTSLHELKVTERRFDTLPKQWRQFPLLRKLDLSEIHFEDKAFTAFARFPMLEEVNLSGCGLQNCPTSLTSLKKLKTLNLSRNFFTSGFPEDINGITSLEALDISKCSIEELPLSFGSLTSLKYLNLRGNAIAAKGSIDAITMLRSLEKLNLEFNQLSQLPESYYSLQSLKKLRELNLSDNSFAAGLPEVVGGLCALEKLDVSLCKLTQLPERLRGLRKLRTLNLSGNHFERLPSFLYELESLEEMDISENMSLTAIENSILQSKSLVRVDCTGNTSLLHPPYAVCKQGLSAISDFFHDLEFGKSKELTVVPVAVVGNSLSGKTSLLRSLQNGKRHLTFRKESSPQDETTRVFQVEDLPLRTTKVKMIDYGGHEVYHIAYHMLIKDRCIPLVVVNLAEFVSLSNSRGCREASRRVCFDWISHLYLAAPQLGSPILTLTHTDELLSSDQVERTKASLLDTMEALRRELLAEEKQELERFPGKAVGRFQNIEHLSNTGLPIFRQEDIFEFNNDLSITSNIELLQKNLESRCKEFVVELPRLWELIEDYLELQWQKPFIAISDVKERFSAVNPTIVLRYMHNSGKISWFENVPELAEYIFHQFSSITQTINLLFHHSSEEQWKKSLSLFEPFHHDGQPISRHEYATFLQAFLTSGVLDEALLVRLLQDSVLPYDVAVKLLRSLFILHGPVEQNHRQAFLVPCLATRFMGDSWKADGQLQLRVEMQVRGLALPKYVFQLMSVAVLKESFLHAESIHFAKNGTTIRHKLGSTHLVHDFNTGRVTLQISTCIKLLGSSWKHLLSSASTICKLLFDSWKVCRVDARIYCACCLFLGEPNPAHEDNPDWFRFMLQTKDTQVSKIDTYSGLDPVFCSKCAAKKAELKDGVPTPFKFPCYNLTDQEIQSLDDFLSVLNPDFRTASQAEEDTSISYAVTRDDSESEVSDVEEQGYCHDDDKTSKILLIKLVRVKKRKVKSWYRNPEKVYQMTDGVRGRALIINIMTFTDGAEPRLGSDVDYKNLSKLFRELRFNIVKTEKELTDLSAEDIFREIKEETQRVEHEHLGMFVLVIMSHGRVGDIILDTKGSPVSLASIQDMLSPSSFPLMAGRPKLLIIQACSGGRPDLGNREVAPSLLSRKPAHNADPASSESLSTNTPPVSSASSADENTGLPHFLVSDDRAGFQPTTLNVDDFLIMKASSGTFSATRSVTHGSWFIRVLVATFYKHSCHRDVESLFKIIQNRVRQVSLSQRVSQTGGNVPIATCTFTNMRKLYLFPNFPSR